ncbi:MAG: phosphonate C-P lyase system protein PhnG [Chloroflexota bacterium]|nr:phosphonate C-P lyase system protein PhnG [Dehalococcoidia bacterium]MDW8255228.1 phosphonate C-P lyase system protein PhnG [Chloroflexota bacterium]
MDRKTCYEWAASLSEAEALALGRLVLEHCAEPVSLVMPPTVGMVMARAIDGALGETFNLGEVLVTEARVALSEAEGWGMVIGSAPDHAVAIALIDAAIARGGPLAAVVERRLREIIESRPPVHPAWEELQATRVAFENF